MQDYTSHSSLFLRYIAKPLLSSLAFLLVVLAHLMLLMVFDDDPVISEVIWLCVSVTVVVCSYFAVKESCYRYIKTAWFFLVMAGVFMFLMHAARMYHLLGKGVLNISFFNSVMISSVLVLMAVSFIFFSQSESSMVKLKRHFILALIIFLSLGTVTFIYNYKDLLSEDHAFSLVMYLVNTNLNVFVLVIGIFFYWISIRRKKSRRKIIYMVLLLCVSLCCMMINFYYIPSYLQGRPSTGGYFDVITTFGYLLIPAASWLECCYMPGSDGDTVWSHFGIIHVSRLERIIPGLSLLLVTVALWLAGEGISRFFFSYGPAVLAVFSFLILLHEWMSYRSEEALISVLSMSPLGVQITSRKMNKNFFINRSMLDIYRSTAIPPDNIIRTIRQKDAGERILEAVSNNVSLLNIEADFGRIDGSTFTAQCRVVPSRFFSYNINLIWMNDITERKEFEDTLARERNLAESQSFYKGSLLETLSAKMLSAYIIGWYSEDAGKGDLVFTDMNSQALEIMNSRESLKGKRYTEIFPNYTPEVLDSFYEVYRSGNSKRMEFYSVSLDKILLVVIFKTGINEIVMLINDLTGQRKIEKDLVERERELDSLMANLPGMAYKSRNDLSFTFEFVSLGSYSLTGYSPEELSGNLLAWETIVHPEDRGEVLAKFKNSADGEGSWSIEYRILDKNGKNRHVTERGSAVRDSSGAILFYEGFIMDVTSLKKAELLLRESEEKVRMSEKIRDIGQMAGGMAHDLNNKLMGISSCLSLMELKFHEPVIKKYSLSIHNIIRESTDIIESVLKYARKINMNRENLDIHPILEKLVTEYSLSLPGGIIIVTQLNAQQNAVFCDGTVIRRVIQDVVSNAADAVASGGVISIVTENRRKESDPDLQDVENSDSSEFILIVVSDTGRGILKENLPRVFDPFFTTKPPGRGSGLGLSAVFGAVQSHGGLVKVDSREGEGTVFSIYLPCVDG